VHRLDGVLAKPSPAQKDLRLEECQIDEPEEGAAEAADAIAKAGGNGRRDNV
jgi:hypothetical protein